MRMNFARSLSIYHSLVLVIIFSSLSFGLYHFWHRGSANIDNIAQVFEANVLVTELRKDEGIEVINQLVASDRSREAIRFIDLKEQEIKKINTTVRTDEFYHLEEDLNTTRQSLNSLISYPEMGAVINVLSNKINGFESFVTGNNWNTLSRTSKRVQSRLSSDRLRSSDFYSFSKISELVRALKSDIDYMKAVTTGSILSQENKNTILTSLSTFEPELEMIRGYVSVLKGFEDNQKRLSNSFNTWIAKVEPAIALKRIEFEKNSQTVFLALIALIGLVGFSFIGGFIIKNISQRSNQKTIEQLLSETIKEGLLPFNPNLSFEFSKEFNHELDKYREYVHKRMSFGTIFQEAMPFSSILLDSNLNVAWANGLFFEHWDIEKNQIEDGSTTWDFLQQFTNLGEDDPVIQALEHSLAGIYQIQVRRRSDSTSLPFEMYVSPVEYAGQKRIMIIFYPLSSLEQTLSDQTKSLVGPVIRSLEALSDGVWNAEFEHRISKDFDIAGISHVFERFGTYFTQVTEQKDQLISEIESLLAQFNQQKNLIDNLKIEVRDQMSKNQMVISEFNQVKQDIINVVELRSNLEELYQSTVQTSKSLLKDEIELLGKARDVNRLLEENSCAFETVCKVRDEFKDLRFQIDHYRTELNRLVDQSHLFQRSSGVDQKLENSLGQIKIEMRNFDKVLTSFSKVSTQLDVGLSKVSMILDRNGIPDLDSLESKFSNSREVIESDLYDVSRLIRDGHVYDDQMIISLKNLYSRVKSNQESLVSIEGLMVVNKPSQLQESEYISAEI
jgi:hypothetical protein